LEHHQPSWCLNVQRYISLMTFSFMIYHRVTRLTRRVSLMEQELPTLPEHLSSPPVFSGVRVTRSLVLYVCFVDRCLFFCTFSFGHCVVCSSSIYGFWMFHNNPWILKKKILDSKTKKFSTQARNPNSPDFWSFVCSVSSVKGRGYCSFCWYWGICDHHCFNFLYIIENNKPC
jgi:hypothetical protein